MAEVVGKRQRKPTQLFGEAGELSDDDDDWERRQRRLRLWLALGSLGDVDGVTRQYNPLVCLGRTGLRLQVGRAV